MKRSTDKKVRTPFVVFAVGKTCFMVGVPSALFFLALFRIAEAFFAAMGAFGKALAAHVYTQGEGCPFRLDLALAMGADVGEGIDAPKGKTANYGDKENGWRYDYVPRCVNRSSEPVDLACGKGKCARNQGDQQCDFSHFFCPFLNSAGLKNS